MISGNRINPCSKHGGDYIVDRVSTKLTEDGKDLNTFFKIEAKCRLKEDASLVDKAFFRSEKNYSNPYFDIEDKVGVRFVVLILDDLTAISNIIRDSEDWKFEECRNYIHDREKDPLLFTYQSIHFVLYPKRELEYQGIKIESSTSCEVQVRTLLQHAHSELTHDSIYKAKNIVKPAVHRTVAKCMALIETTDDFFSAVTRSLKEGPFDRFNISQQMDYLYLKTTGFNSHDQKSSLEVWYCLEQFIDSKLIAKLDKFVTENEWIGVTIKSRYFSDYMYQQSIVIFLYWLLRTKKRQLLQLWPLSDEILELLANDVGVSIKE